MQINKDLKRLTPEQFEKWFNKYIKPSHEELEWKVEYDKINIRPKATTPKKESKK